MPVYYIISDTDSGFVRALRDGEPDQLSTFIGHPVGGMLPIAAAHAIVRGAPMGLALAQRPAVNTLVDRRACQLRDHGLRLRDGHSQPYGFVVPGYDEGPPAMFDHPSGVAYDATYDRLYIADTDNHVVRMAELGGVSPDTVVTIAGVPQYAGFDGDGTNATNRLLDSPMVLAIGIDHQLYIADTGNHRVRALIVDGGTGPWTLRTVIGDGVPATGDGGSQAGDVSVESPRALAIDDFGNLYVASPSKATLSSN